MNDSSHLASDLEFAFALGQRASEVALPLFRSGVVARQKPDGSLVTEADTEVERRLLALLAEQRPDDAAFRAALGSSSADERLCVSNNGDPARARVMPWLR